MQNGFWSLFYRTSEGYTEVKLVGNKAKGRISKQVFLENKAR